jgi:hypothetical protein
MRPSRASARRREERAALIDFARRRHGPPPAQHRPKGSPVVIEADEDRRG